ncbi:MAG: hypothetical protein KFH87_03905 [Bacteroidetes bacterium]|nr:hypothetical protein [Bacteroidota bacterium]
MIASLMGCGNNETEKTRQERSEDVTSFSTFPLLPGAVLVDSMSADMTGDGQEELIIVSQTEEYTDDPLLVDRFDRVDLYTRNDTGITQLFVDPVDYGLSFSTEDVTGDGVTDLLVHLDAGGNNPISTQGLHVYGLNASRKVTLLFYSPSGAPVLHDIDENGQKEILVADQYWGMMPHSEVIGFTRFVYAFDGNSYVESNARFAAWFDTILEKQRRAYARSLRSSRSSGSEDQSNEVYLRAAEYLAWNLPRGGARRVRTVWRAEEDVLRRHLNDEQFSDLQTFVEDVMIMEQETSAGRQ